MIAYVAAPIDFDPQGRVAQIRDHTIETLRKRGYWVYDPSSAWKAPTEFKSDGSVQEGNWGALDVADLVVCILMRDVFTIGTVLEMAYTKMNRPMTDLFVVGDIGNSNISLDYLEVPVYESIEVALS